MAAPAPPPPPDKLPSPRDPARDKLLAVLMAHPSLSELRGAIEVASLNGLEEADLAQAQQMLDEKLQHETDHLRGIMDATPTAKVLEAAIAHSEHVGAQANTIAEAKVQLAKIKLHAASPLIKDVKEFQAAIKAANFAGVDQPTILAARKALEARKKLKVVLESHPTVRILNAAIDEAAQSGLINEQDVEDAKNQMVHTAIRNCPDAHTFRDALVEAEQADKLVIVHFCAMWSFPCQMVVPQYLELALELGRRDCSTLFIEIDVDVNLAVTDKYEVLAFPTFSFFKDKEVVDTFLGADVDKVRSTIEEKAPGGLDGLEDGQVSPASAARVPRPPADGDAEGNAEEGDAEEYAEGFGPTAEGVEPPYEEGGMAGDEWRPMAQVDASAAGYQSDAPAPPPGPPPED